MATTRTRTRNMSVPSARTERFSYPWAPGGHTLVFYPSYSGDVETITDNNNKGFEKLRRAGLVILSDVQLSRTSRTFTPGHQTATSSEGWSGDISGDCMKLLQYGPSNMPNSTVSQVNQDVLFMKAYAKMNQSSLMSGETFATLGQTISMLRRPFKGAQQLLGRMVKHRNARLGKTTKSAALATSSTWLEYRYGWQPLILDCKEVIKHSHKKREDCERKHLVARAGDSFSNSGSGSWPLKENVGGGRASEGTQSWSNKTRTGVGVMYDVKNRTSSDELGKLFGTRLRDIPATLWELVPYSFVVDWFTNIGDWIQAITPDPNVEVRGWWATVVAETEYTRSGSSSRPSYIPAAQQYWTGPCGSETVKSFTYTRICNQPISFTPRLTFKPLSALHQVDALALSASRIISGLKGFRH